jgi:hypothetical protein
METNGNCRGCPKWALPKTMKTAKPKQPKQPKTLPNRMDIKGNVRGCPRGPYHKLLKPLSKNNQNHQQHHHI